MSITLDDLRFPRSPEGIAELYHRLGYEADLEPVGLSAVEALLEGSLAEAVQTVYMLVNLPGGDGLQHIHFEVENDQLSSATIRKLAENFLKRPGNYMLSFATTAYDRTIFVKPSRAESRVKITRLSVNPHRPSSHEYTVLNEIAVKSKVGPLELHAQQVRAFDVERVTNKFYETYKTLFYSVRDTIKLGNPNVRIGPLKRNTTDDSQSLHAFTQRLLSRIVFLYFIQKKNWLDSQPDFLRKLFETRVPDESVNFYRDVLEPLFFETLNRKRVNQHSQFGNIPYLNGSLFECEYPEQTVLNMPNAMFDPRISESIIGVLERFNFTVEESSSLEQEVSLDPEMLGKVFENLMEEEEAARSGTFYTPRSIVQFLAEESITRYLSDATGVTLERLRTLIGDDELHSDLTSEEARAIIQKLAAVRVLDPAVGTASMLVGTLNVMIRIRRSCAARLGTHVELGTPTIAEWKKEYINHCLYGVDIKQEAIEIGRLRLWLSLVVDAREPEPLPNLDYKLMAGDGVLETVDGARFGDTGGLLGEDARINDLIRQLERTRDAFFSEENPAQRQQKRAELIEMERELFGLDVDWRVKNLDEQITVLRRRAHSKKGDTAKDLELTTQLNKFVEMKRKVFEEKEPLPFFLHRVHFSEVMLRENPGFDIVIGNPPYVRMERLEPEYKTALHKAFDEVKHGSADLYVYFYKKGMDLLRNGGRLAFITPNKFLRAGYGAPLRKYLSEKTKLETLIDFGDLPVFDATTYPFITITQKQARKKDRALEAIPERALEMIPERTLKAHIGDARTQGVTAVREGLSAFHHFARDLVKPIQQSELRGEGWLLDDPAVLALLEKLRRIGKPLGQFIDETFYRGILTGLNEAFVIDRETRDRLIAEDPKSDELIKPLLRGRDVKRWEFNFAEKYLIFLRQKSVRLDDYPAIRRYLEPFRTRLEPKPHGQTGKWSGRKPGPYKWFELQDQIAYYPEFEKNKIVWAKYGLKLAFVFDDQKRYFLNTNYFMTTEKRWLVPVIQSNLIELFAYSVFNTVQGGFLEVITQSVTQIPIVEPTPAQQVILESFIDDSRAAELNALVYEMYGLTPDEIALVEAYTAASSGAGLPEDSSSELDSDDR